jgi:hypothetical protein
MFKGLGRDVRTTVVAVVVAALVLAAPAAAIVANADKVDGRHAVGAAATKAGRADKLVATNSNGYLPNNIVLKAQNSDKLDGLDSTRFLKATSTPTVGKSAGTPRVLSGDWQEVSSLSGAGQALVVPDGGVIVVTVGGMFNAADEGGYLEIDILLNGTSLWEDPNWGRWDPGDADGNVDQAQSFTAVLPVEAAGTYDVTLRMREQGVTNHSTLEGQSIVAVWYPYSPYSS